MRDEFSAQWAMSKVPGCYPPSIAIRAWLRPLRCSFWAVAAPAQGVDGFIAPFD